MSNIKITARVTDSKLEIVNPVLLSSGSRDVVQVQLEFNAMWDGYTKIAYFYRESGKEKGKVYHALLSNNVATVPHEVLAEEGTFFFGIWGEGGNFPTTEAVRLNVTKGLITLEKVATDPTPDIYQQVIASYHSMENRFNAEMARLDSLIAMRSNEVEREYTFGDYYVEGMIRTNGASAYIETRIKGEMELDQDDAYWIVLPANLAPLMPTALKNEHNPTELAISLELEDNGELRLYFRNLTLGYIIFGYTFASATYPLAHVALDELVDARTGASGKVYPSTGQAMRSQFGQLDGRTSALAKRVTNLEQGKIPSPFVTDDSVAYQKIAPANALPFAELSKLGGMTRRCTNYFDKSKVNAEGVTVTDTGFKFTWTGTPMAPQNIGLLKTIAPQLRAGDVVALYVKTIGGSYGDALYLAGGTGDWFSGAFVTITESDLNNAVYAYGVNGVVCEYSEITITKIENAPYEPYFEGLRSAPVSEVESVGENLCRGMANGAWVNATGKYNAEFANYKCTVKTPIDPSRSYVVSTKEGFSIETSHFFDADEIWLGTAPLSSIPAAARFVAFNIKTNGAEANVQLEIGTTPTSYKPHVRDVLQIPAAVQALDGYGEGVGPEAHNYIDWEKRQFVKNVKTIVFDGSDDENWLVQQYTNLTAYLNVYDFGLIPLGIICDAFPVFQVISSQPNGTIGVAVEGLNYSASSFFFGISGLASNVSEWRAYLAAHPVTVVYKLPAPEITDISDLLPADNFVNAGMITFKNPHGLEVPSEIIYQIKEASV